MKKNDYADKISQTEYNLLGSLLLDAAERFFADQEHQKEYEKQKKVKKVCNL